MYNFSKILLHRYECIVFQAEEYTNGSNGWIGGNVPKYFLDNKEFVENYRNDYYFYLTLINPFDTQKMFSIFVPNDYEQLWEKNIYPNCSILLFEHSLSNESDNTIFTNPNIMKHAISKGKMVSNPEQKLESYLIKFGGTPDLIQGSAHYSENLLNDSLEFLFQIDEDGYPCDVDFIKGNYPFSFGAVYVYAKISDDTIENPCVGFWQFS